MKEKPNRIAELRHKFGISQEKLAEEINATQASVSLYENGSNIPVDALISIARYFGVTLEYLLRLPDDKSPTPIDGVSPEEYNILLLYRSLPPNQRRLADKLVIAVMETTGL